MNIPFLRQLVGVAGAVALLAGAVSAAAAQQGAITGSVVDQAGNPVPAARILLGATNRGAVTNSEGKYSIPGVAPGTYLVRVAIIGYAGEGQQVTVRAGESVPLDFKLKPVALSLDAVLVTTSGEQRTREVANAIATIRAADITETRDGFESQKLTFPTPADASLNAGGCLA